jgi:hypothetical protein
MPSIVDRLCGVLGSIFKVADSALRSSECVYLQFLLLPISSTFRTHISNDIPFTHDNIFQGLKPRDPIYNILPTLVDRVRL